ncbi:MAG: hypothetical protein RIB41_10075 [Oceanibaculum nanhaiense]|jgi:uncharacterized phiE125 gp8 family phage protein|uniref:head-tail connector protein n=1 Tax=Oceanibaculum nanhaiense TaxID=1909734 RepID=UPI0032EDB1FB
MMNKPVQLAAPVIEPITLAEARADVKVDLPEDDARLQREIRAAREQFESETGVILTSRPMRIAFDCFNGEIWIPTGPVLSIDALRYVDMAGEVQTLEPSAYQWRAGIYEAYVRPAYGRSWPQARPQYDSVQIDFTAGWPGTGGESPSADLVPGNIKQALLWLVAKYFDDSAATAYGDGIDRIINAYKVGRVA